MRKSSAFTLTELMIVVAIIAIISVVGGISLTSRLAVSRLEGAVQTLASDVSYARSAALFKGCPTRIILCEDASCVTKATSTTSSGVIGSGTEPARYYAVLRRTQYASSAQNCYSSGSDSDAGDARAFAEWDYDRKPQALPRGVAFSPIYTNQVLNTSDWSSISSVEAGNSIWFPTSISDTTASLQGVVNIPVDSSSVLDSASRSILFQLQLDSCDASNADDDCRGYFVTIDESGETAVRGCTAGTRTNTSDICF